MRAIDFSSWQSLLATLIGLALVTLIGMGIRVLMMVTIQQRRERMNRQINERLRVLIAAYKTLGGSFTGDLAVDPRHLRDLRRQELSPAEDWRAEDLRTEDEGAAAAAQPGGDVASDGPPDEQVGQPIARSAQSAQSDQPARSADQTAAQSVAQSVLQSAVQSAVQSDRTRRIRDAVEAALSDILLLGTEEHVRLAERAARELVAGRPVRTHELVVSLRGFIREALDLDPVPADLAIPVQGPTRPSGAGGRGRSERGGEGARQGAGGKGGGMGMGGGIGLGIGSHATDGSSAADHST